MACELANEEGITIKRSEPVMVHAAEETVGGFYYLSNLDQNIAVIMQTVHCFKAPEGKSTECASQVIKESLAKVLVHYYPFTGSLTISLEGKLIIKLDDSGVPFVEAVAECDLELLGDICIPDPVKLGKLVYLYPDAKNLLEMPLLSVQVTRFKCGGFVVGMALNHCLSDGLAAVQFLHSWAEIARGLALSNPPFLDRTMQRARKPPQIEFPHHEFATVYDVSGMAALFETQELRHRSFTFDAAKLARLKGMAMEDGSIDSCTSFAALTAFVWRARSQALNMTAQQKTKLLFAVDGRARMEPPLPAGFFGNGIVLACCLCEAGELISRPLSYAVRMVQSAVKGTTNAFIRSAIDYFEETRARPSMDGTLLVTAWTRLKFSSSDFGWGEAVQSGPACLPGKEVALFLPQSKESKSTVVVIGLPASCMDTFEQLMQL